MAEPNERGRRPSPSPCRKAAGGGRLGFQKGPLFAPANGDGSRKLILDGADGRLRFVMANRATCRPSWSTARPIRGSPRLDVVREAERDVYEPLQLPFGYCRLVVCGRASTPTGRCGWSAARAS